MLGICGMPKCPNVAKNEVRYKMAGLSGVPTICNTSTTPNKKTGKQTTSDPHIQDFLYRMNHEMHQSSVE